MVCGLSDLNPESLTAPRSFKDSGPTFSLKENAMKKLISAAMFLLFAVVSTATLAEIRTVTLAVSGMT